MLNNTNKVCLIIHVMGIQICVTERGEETHLLKYNSMYMPMDSKCFNSIYEYYNMNMSIRDQGIEEVDFNYCKYVVDFISTFNFQFFKIKKMDQIGL